MSLAAIRRYVCLEAILTRGFATYSICLNSGLSTILNGRLFITNQRHIAQFRALISVLVAIYGFKLGYAIPDGVVYWPSLSIPCVFLKWAHMSLVEPWLRLTKASTPSLLHNLHVAGASLAGPVLSKYSQTLLATLPAVYDILLGYSGPTYSIRLYACLRLI
jgi:hypothetical protein